MIQLRNEIEDKYPGLYKTLSKLKSYVKNNEAVMKSFMDVSGYTRAETLSLLSLKNLANIVKVGGTSEWGQFFSEIDPENVHIRTNLASSIDSGGFKAKMLGISEGTNGTSFFAGITVLHELTHYGRFWNNLPQMYGKFEAGQVFETNSFGSIQGIRGSTQSAIKNGW